MLLLLLLQKKICQIVIRDKARTERQVHSPKYEQVVFCCLYLHDQRRMIQQF